MLAGHWVDNGVRGGVKEEMISELSLEAHIR